MSPSPDAYGRHRSTHRPPGINWRPVSVVTQIVAGLLSVALLITFGLYWYKYHSFNGGLNRLNVFGQSLSKPASDVDGKDQNILIVGNDDRETATDAELRQLGTGRDGGSLNTDTMMLIHVPKDGSKATLISFPRDSWVSIPGQGMGKLNSAYPDAFNAAAGSANTKRAAGAKLLIETLQDLTGLTIDHYVQVDLLGFYRISNAIGGVKVNMCAAVSEPNSGINLPKGISVIKGKQALAFVRQRYNFPNGLGDLDRVERQRYFLTAAFRKLTTAGVLLNLTALDKLLNAVRTSLYMDSGINLVDLAKQMQKLSADNIVGKTIPTDGFGNENGQSTVVVNPEEVKTYVHKLVAPPTALDTAKLVSPSTVTVDIINGGGVDGAGGTNSTTLHGIGFKVGKVTTATAPSATTTIHYAGGSESQAKTLAKYVPGATLVRDDKVGHVTLVLGKDGRAAKKPTASSSSSSTATAPANRPIDAKCIN